MPRPTKTLASFHRTPSIEVSQVRSEFAPFELLFGCTIRVPLQIIKELWKEEEKAPKYGKVFNMYLNYEKN